MSLQILNSGKQWTSEEDIILAKLYNDQKLDIFQIAEIHQRAPGGIIARLLKNKIIVDKKFARGYNIQKVDKKGIQKIKHESDKIIMIDNKEYISNDIGIWEIKKSRGKIFGLIDPITDQVISYTESSKKIIDWLENYNDQEISIGYIGNQFEYISNYLEGQIKFTNCMTEIKQKFDIIITNNFFESNLSLELKVEKVNSLFDNLNDFGELILVEKQCFYESIIPLIINTKVIINETFSNYFFLRTIKKEKLSTLETICISNQVKEQSSSSTNNLMVLDTETTGFPSSRNPQELDKFNNARLIELGYIIFDKTGKDIKKYDDLIKPNNFVITNTYVHGITHENAVKNGKNINQVLDQLTLDLKNVDGIICHNISFDMAIILSEAYRANKLELIKLINQKLHLCSMAIGKKFMKNDKNPKLIELYKFLFNKDFIQDHRALSDCVACLDCFLSMISI
jgi:DNA polymerase-3 subunit epsilon